MHSCGAVAKLGGTDRKMIVAVIAQSEPRFRSMLRWRHRAVHRDRHTLALEPIGAFRAFDPIAAHHRLLHQVKTLVESVAAKLGVGSSRALGNHLIVRLHHVDAAKFKWLDL